MFKATILNYVIKFDRYLLQMFTYTVVSDVFFINNFTINSYKTLCI